MTGTSKPYHIRHYTPAEIAEARRMPRAVPADLAPDSHPVHKLVAEAIADYNRAHPGANIRTPQFISLPNQTYIRASYIPGPDTLVISSNVFALPPQQIKALIGHELRHKHIFETRGILTHEYDLQRLIAAAQPDLFAICEKEGVSETQALMRLPGNALDWRPSGIGNNWPAFVQKEIREKDQQDYDKNWWERMKLAVKLWQSPSCTKAIDTVWQTLPRALDTLHRDTTTYRHQQEIDADLASKRMYGPAPFLSVLLRAAKSADDSPERNAEERALSHPSAQTRIEALGCTLKKTVSHDYVADCTPPPNFPVVPDPHRSGQSRPR